MMIKVITPTTFFEAVVKVWCALPEKTRDYSLAVNHTVELMKAANVRLRKDNE